MDYKQKYSAQQLVIKENYATFDVPYNGTDNNDYADGDGFCCNDGSPEAAQARVMAAKGNFQEPDAYEKLQFYYHPDHLGSSSYITNLDGEVVQHIEYVPFGEVFFEERNSIWNTPYLFNAKEFDEETGLYYYGARYYDSRLSVWISTDPMQEKYSAYSTYCYVFNRPIIFFDPNGEEGLREWWSNNKMGTRSMGLIKGVGGLLEAAAGAIGGGATSWTGVGAVAGGLAVAHGCDVATSGFTQMISGESTDSYTSKTLQAAGVSQETANMIDGGVSIILSAGSASLSTASNTTKVAQASTTGTAASKATATSNMTKVGRWMSPKEYESLSKTGRLVEGGGGQTFVATGGSQTFQGAAKGSVYVEFDVPTKSLLQGGKEGWYKLIGPNASPAMKHALNKKGGSFVTDIEVKNLSPILDVK